MTSRRAGNANTFQVLRAWLMAAGVVASAVDAGNASEENVQDAVFAQLAQDVRGPAIGHQRNPAISSVGGSLGVRLAVWDDKRKGNEDIYGRFLQGSSSQSLPFPIAAVAGDQKRPAACPTADGTLVIWEDFRNTSDQNGPRDIYAAKVDVQGNVTPRLGVPIRVTQADSNDVELAALGTGILAVWDENASTTVFAPEIYLSRFSSEGDLLPEEPVLIDSDSREPAIAGAEDHALLVYESNRTTEGGRTTIMFRLLRWTEASAPLAIGSSVMLADERYRAADPAVAWDGQCYLAVWGTQAPGVTDDFLIVARRIARDGIPIDPTPLLLAGPTEPRDLEVTALGRGEFNVLTTMRDPAIPFGQSSRQLLVSRTIRFGSVIDLGQPRIVDTGPLSRPQDPAMHSAIFAPPYLLWEDQRFETGPDAGEEIFGRPLDGTPGDILIISEAGVSGAGPLQSSAPTLAIGAAGEMATAFATGGGEAAHGLFLAPRRLSDPLTSPLALGPVSGRLAADGSRVAWLLGSGGFGNARLLLDAGSPERVVAPFGYDYLAAVALAGDAVLALRQDFGQTRLLLRQVADDAPDIIYDPPVAAATLPGSANFLNAVIVQGEIFFTAGKLFSDDGTPLVFGRVVLGSSGLNASATTVEITRDYLSSEPALIAHAEGAELLHGGQSRFWPVGQSAPRLGVPGLEPPSGAIFAHAAETDPATMIWPDFIQIHDEASGAGRHVNVLRWQAVGPGGERFGPVAELPLPEQAGLYSAAAARHPSGYLALAVRSPLLKLAHLRPLSLKAVEATLAGTYHAHWEAVSNADLAIETSHDLRTWEFSECLRTGGSGDLFSSPADAESGSRLYWRARYALPP